jgi:hypothetical protein
MNFLFCNSISPITSATRSLKKHWRNEPYSFHSRFKDPLGFLPMRTFRFIRNRTRWRVFVVVVIVLEVFRIRDHSSSTIVKIMTYRLVIGFDPVVPSSRRLLESATGLFWKINRGLVLGGG